MNAIPLLDNEIHLWRHSLGSSDGVSQLLSPDELARAARFRFDIHRRRFIAARGRLRQILSSYLDTDPAAICFTYNSYGKPSIEGDLRFNLSHTGDVAVYAIAHRRDLGVDVEQVQPRFAEERIPEAFFSPGEVRTLRALPHHLQAEAFFLCWTRKEAYVKARAEGLSIPLNSFDVSLTPGEPARFLRNGEGWGMASFRIEPDCAGALVAAGTDWSWRFVD